MPEDVVYTQIFINKTQYFTNVPSQVWNFEQDGIKPLQKWLEDRQGYKLELKDIQQFNKMVLDISEKLIDT